MQVMPDAEIVPIVIDGSWELVRYNLLPVPFGRTVSLTILEPLFRSDFEPKQLVSKCEQVISERLTAQRLDSVKQEH
jgi:1-acyl-sn-glycerol-3-phosphate acyltransferase